MLRGSGARHCLLLALVALISPLSPAPAPAFAAEPPTRPTAAPLAASLLVGEPGADRARKIAFVCDDSAAVGNKLGAVREALAAAVAGLRQDQSFALVFSGDSKVNETEWLKAGEQGSRSAGEFLKGIRPSEKADLPAAFDAALRLRPEAILVLADARSADPAALSRKIKEAGRDARVRVDLAVIGGDGTPEKTTEALKELAASTGGAFRSVDAKAFPKADEAPTAAAGSVTAPPTPAAASEPPALPAPPVQLFTGSGDARSLVFALDASGSMLNKMGSLKSETHRAVDGLRPNQSFNVIFFQDAKCVALSRGPLMAGTPENKRKAYAFLDAVTTTGTTDPIPGTVLAFAQHPQVVYLLTDGDFPDNLALKTRIAELNRDHKTKVNTIAFVNNSDTDTEFLKLLEEIAKANGGTYQHVNEQELAGGGN